MELHKIKAIEEHLAKKKSINHAEFDILKRSRELLTKHQTYKNLIETLNPDAELKHWVLWRFKNEH